MDAWIAGGAVAKPRFRGSTSPIRRRPKPWIQSVESRPSNSEQPGSSDSEGPDPDDSDRSDADDSERCDPSDSEGYDPSGSDSPDTF